MLVTENTMLITTNASRNKFIIIHHLPFLPKTLLKLSVPFFWPSSRKIECQKALILVLKFFRILTF